MDERDTDGTDIAASGNVAAGSWRIVRVAAGMLIAALVILALYVGRGIIQPLVIAFLLAFILSPPVAWMARRGLPRPLGATVVMAVLLVAIAAFGVLLSAQVRSLAADLPTYQSTILRKLTDLRDSVTAPGVFSRAFETLDRVQREVVGQGEQAAQAGRQVVHVAPNPGGQLREAVAWGGQALEPLATLGIVLFFVFVALVERRDLRDRLIRLMGGDVHRTTDSMKEAGARVSRYLLMQVIVNVTYGIPLGIGLWMIGVPGALLWGSVAAVLRFIPYLGPLISSVFPVALAFAVDDGWNVLIWTVALIVTLELISNNIVEPLLYGSSTGLSAMSLIASAMFWTALWGPLGLVLSTPLTVCILAMGRNLPGLGFLETLLGSTPPMDRPTRFYQLLVTGETEEASESAHAAIEKDGLVRFYDDVGLRVLEIARDDYLARASAAHRFNLTTGFTTLLAELRESLPGDATEGPPAVICLGGKWEIDRIGAEMLAHALDRDGIHAVARSATGVDARNLPELGLTGHEVVVLSYFRADPVMASRHMARRLRIRWPNLTILVAAWAAPPELLDEAARERTGAEAIVTSVAEAVGRVKRKLAPEARTAPTEPGEAVEAEGSAREQAIARSRIGEDRLREELDDLARRVADALDMDIATISVMENGQEVFIGQAGRIPPAMADDQGRILPVPADRSLGGLAMAEEAPLVVPDIERDARFVEDGAARRLGARFVGGTRIGTSDGVVVGALSVLDAERRELTEKEAALMGTVAKEVAAAIWPSGKRASRAE